jgi:hypothetical protein
MQGAGRQAAQRASVATLLIRRVLQRWAGQLGGPKTASAPFSLRVRVIALDQPFADTNPVYLQSPVSSALHVSIRWSHTCWK